jgi:hypothetical protein
MKALQPEGIRIRPSETVVVRIGKPMRLENAAPRCRTASNSGKHKTSASKHRLFGRSFEQATGKAAVCLQADTAQGKTPLLQAAAVQNFRRNKQKAV